MNKSYSPVTSICNSKYKDSETRMSRDDTLITFAIYARHPLQYIRVNSLVYIRGRNNTFM